MDRLLHSLDTANAVQWFEACIEATIQKRSTNELVRGIGHESRNVRLGAAFSLALRKQKGENAVQALIDRLDDADNVFQKMCRNALIECGLKAIPLLLKAQEQDKRKLVVGNAVYAIVQISRRYPSEVRSMMQHAGINPAASWLGACLSKGRADEPYDAYTLNARELERKLETEFRTEKYEIKIENTAVKLGRKAVNMLVKRIHAGANNNELAIRALHRIAQAEILERREQKEMTRTAVEKMKPAPATLQRRSQPAGRTR